VSPFTTPAPLFPTMHSPPFPNRSIPPRGAFPRRGPVRVIVPAVSPVVPILLGCPPFVVQFARKSLVKWAKGAVWNRVLVQFARENLGKWAESAIWSRVFASLCPLRPTFPSCRTSRRSVCCGAAGVALLGVRVQERNLDQESTACTHQPWRRGHDIEGHQEGGSGMRSLPLIISSRKAMCCPWSHISMSACIRI